ncbi:MAG: hypothetical protein V2I67_16515 [Thermoanaerobaculales bacterium]|nr:hypothetical protein [Thermoanaerobaculales bacterium]
MNELRIDLDGNRSHFLPGDDVGGGIVWRLSEPAEALELRLFWHTSGKGTEDVGIVRVHRVDDPGAFGEQEFSFRLPAGPYAFSGALITLAWSIELVTLPGKATERVDITVAPTPVEVRLQSLGRPPKGGIIKIGSTRR